ncbi:hypothetical protein [Burkholderia ambifaria]|uniref:hypothetical protein n=1 Tax=Burkholderia ambifaria TaxID=152480 RepID=UPI001FC8D83D|nr:hypothetical protein [Burkholderia ambifaria]
MMPVVKSFTQAQWDAAARRLEALPEKPAHEHRVNVRDAVKSMRSRISDAQRKGYTLDEIVQQLAQEGVDISASTLRYAMQRAAKEGRSEPVKKKSTTVSATASQRTRKPDQARPLHAEKARNGHQQDGGRADSKPGAMVMRDAFSFEITPDVENL